MFTQDHFYMPPIADPPLTHSTSHPFHSLVTPRPGQTRCYWALLSPDLEFLYIDPVFRSHLGPQADPIIRTRLLDFVHPDEYATAQQDLGKVLDNHVLHGSVTRVRYSRLGRARARLGYTGLREKFVDEDKVSFDDDYMAADLVINWAAEGLVLCFIHAVVDISPQDNDEHSPTPWSNWCGTPVMSSEETERLYNALLSFFPHTSQLPMRVFQILKNTADRPALLSWPHHGYSPSDYRKLAENVQMGGVNGSDAKTSCTRRYKAQHNLHNTEVESIFIPHGSIIFACYTIIPHRSRNGPSSLYPLYAPGSSFYDQSQHHYSQYGSPLTVPSQVESYSDLHAYRSQSSHHHSYVHPNQPTFQSSFQASGRNSPPTGLRSSGTHATYHQESQWPSSASHTSTYTDRPSQSVERQSPPYVDEVPPPGRQRGSRLSPSPGGSGSSRGGQPPPGITMCAACKSTSSPEWRKGPSGKKDLCNACGLRYSRQKAKKEGVSSTKRRKDGLKTEDMDSPSASSKRRAYGSIPYHEPGAEGHRTLVSPPDLKPSSPVDYSSHRTVPHYHGVSSSLYSYPSNSESRHDSMYFTSSHPSQPPSTYTHHQQQHHHSGSFFVPPNSSTADFSMSPSSDPSRGVTTPISSYERTGIHGHQPRSDT